MVSKRHNYTGDLARPLKAGETPESKLALLMTDLGVTTEREAVLGMLVRHVIGKNVRDYPKSLTKPLSTGDHANQRLPLLHGYLGAKDDVEALIKMARRHVLGFRCEESGQKGGRHSAVAKRGENYFDYGADVALLRELIDVMRETGKKSGGGKLTVLDCAKRISSSQPNPGDVDRFYKVPPKILVELYHDRKRDDAQAHKEIGDIHRRLGRLIQP
jgi:hypothetical protein